MKKVYPFNPTCSNILTSLSKDGKGTNFVYFYYKSPDGHRKQVKFADGMNVSGLSQRKLNQATEIQKGLAEDLLTTMHYDGNGWVEVEDTKPYITKIITEFLADKTMIDENTVSSYTADLKVFTRYLSETNQDKLTLTDFTPELLERFLKYISVQVRPSTEKPYAKSTLCGIVDKVSIFGRWCKKKKYITENPRETADFGTILKGDKGSKKHKSYTIEEFQSILKYFRDLGLVHQLTVVVLIYYTHLRIEEILKLRLRDYNIKQKFIFLPEDVSKNGKARDIPMDKPLFDFLSGLDIDWNANPNLFFVGTNKHNRMDFLCTKKHSYGALYDRFEDCKEALKLNPLNTFYGIKHSASVHEFLFEGFSKEMIKVKSGHATIQQTETYLRSLDEIINVPDYQERVLKFEI